MKNSRSHKKIISDNFTKRLAIVFYLIFCIFSFKTKSVIAQVESDGTLAIPTRVVRNGSDFSILDGTQAGVNLFHSFSLFSVPTGGSTTFNTSQYNGIQNIFSRITGNLPSSIDGIIQYPTGTNLFLLNPNGFIFGSNARLNAGGSLLATTGKAIRFADGTEFSATAQTPTILSINVPIGVQFGTNPGNIQVNGANLRNPEYTLGLLGGNITTTGGERGLQGNEIIATPAGRIELGSVGSNSFVSFSTINQGFTLGYNQVQDFQDLRALQNSLITADNGGSIQVQVKNFQLSGGSQLGTLNTPRSSLPGGTVVVNASESIELLGTGIYQLSSGSGEFPTLLLNRTSSNRDAGTLSINTKNLIIRDGALISASTFSSGQGGSLTVSSTNSINISGFSATSPNLFSGISVTANRTSTGNAGNLVVNTENLSVSNGGQITASTFGKGQGGSLTINASRIELIGGSANQPNGLFAQVGVLQNNSNATGQGGSLTVNTNKLSVLNGSRVSTETFGGGNAGNLVVNAGEVTVAGRSRIDQSPSLISASSVSAGAAGNLSVFADRVTVKDSGAIAVSGTGSGIAGNLQVNSPFILLENQGKLLAETKAGQGNITINTSDLRLRDNSLISTNATGRATGGNLSIFTQTLVAFENSDITANAEESFGGRVTVRAAAIFGTQFRLFLTPESDITATSALGPDFGGSVTLQTFGIDPSQGIIQLESDILDLSQLVVATCSRGSQQATGEFFVTGRGGLPTTPSESATDDRILVDLGRPRINAHNSPSRNTNTQITIDKDQLLQAQGWVVDTDGKIRLTAQTNSSIPHQSSLLFSTCNQ